MEDKVVNDLPYDVPDDLKFNHPADPEKTEEILDLVKRRYEDLDFFFHYLLANVDRLDYEPEQLENFYYAMCIIQTSYDIGRTDGVEDQDHMLEVTLNDEEWLGNIFWKVDKLAGNKQ
jgi:hypothetical protein